MTHLEYRYIRDEYCPIVDALDNRMNFGVNVSWIEIECLWSIREAVEEYFDTSAA